MTLRRQYAGGASAVTLQASMTSVAATASLSDNSGWPSGSVGPFAVVIDRGTNTEEKVLCSAQAANTLTITTRGYDGTGSSAHAAGATVELCITAIDLDEANAHTSANSGVHGTTSSVVGVTDIQTLTNKTLVQPVIGDHTNANHDHSSTAQGGQAGVLTTPGQTLQAHFGTVSLSPGGTTVSFAHGAPFTPVTGFISAAANVAFTSAVITSYSPTTLAVAFYDAASNSPLSIGTCNISYVVFG